MITMSDHLIFGLVQPVKQSIQVHEQFQGVNYIAEIKKLSFKCFGRLGSYVVLMLSGEVLMQQYSIVLQGEPARSLCEEDLSWSEGLP